MSERDQSKVIRASSVALCAAALLASGCGRLLDQEDREPFGTYGSDDDGDDDSEGVPGEPPGSGGEVSESCWDGVLQPGEICQVQDDEEIPAGIDPCSLSVADFDDDGRPDIAVPNSDPFLTPGAMHVANVLRGFGNGGFAPAQPTDSGSELPVGLAVGDFDGDGRTDLATANNDAQQAFIMRNEGGVGSMAFAAPQGVGVASVASSIDGGDFTGDGIDDLAVNTPDGVKLLRGSPSGVELMTTIDVGGNAMYSKIVDLDADGFNDMITVVSSGTFGGAPGTMWLFHGSPGGFAETAVHELEGDPWWVDAGDLNMDGDLDLAVAEYSTNRVSLRTGSGFGGFSPPTYVDVCEGPQSVAIGDMNNDGANDLVVGCMDEDLVQMWIQAEDGKFELARWWVTGSRPVSVKVADFNLDGQLDVAWASQFSNTVGVVLSRI